MNHTTDEVDLAIAMVTGVPVRILRGSFMYRTVGEIRHATRGMSPWDIEEKYEPDKR